MIKVLKVESRRPFTELMFSKRLDTFVNIPKEEVDLSLVFEGLSDKPLSICLGSVIVEFSAHNSKRMVTGDKETWTALNLIADACVKSFSSKNSTALIVLIHNGNTLYFSREEYESATEPDEVVGFFKDSEGSLHNIIKRSYYGDLICRTLSDHRSMNV